MKGGAILQDMEASPWENHGQLCQPIGLPCPSCKPVPHHKRRAYRPACGEYWLPLIRNVNMHHRIQRGRAESNSQQTGRSECGGAVEGPNPSSNTRRRPCSHTRSTAESLAALCPELPGLLQHRADLKSPSRHSFAAAPICGVAHALQEWKAKQPMGVNRLVSSWNNC